MRIFITGGTGFIGRHIVKKLESEDHTLLLLSRQTTNRSHLSLKTSTNILRGDLSQIDGLKNNINSFSPDVCIHLAWESLPDYGAETSSRNLSYGLNLITALAECGCKCFIGVGSCWEYGQRSGKLSEDLDPKPLDAFASAKNSLHLRGRQIAEEHGMNFIWTRLFYIYGPGQRETSPIPYNINSLSAGMMPDIKTPSVKNDFLYVGDAARAFSAIIKKPDDGVYNIGSGMSTSIREITEITCREFKFPGSCATLSNIANSPIIDFWADISRIRNEIGWEPQISISEGIQQTIKYHTEDGAR